MRSRQVDIGRTFVVVFDHEEDFFIALDEFCRTNNVRQRVISSFIAGPSARGCVTAASRAGRQPYPIAGWSSTHGNRR
jgi:predicted DNA-binding protein with PD1-like motif